ncbi:MAG TPA: hypothetical protein VLA16_19290, partial [Ideonella sp.]|nr:hypothetical protein [Ideonella sp.]
MNTLAMSPFLRRVLTADAALSGASAVLMLAGSGSLSSLTGLPTTLLAVAGAALLPYVAWLLWLARRPAVPRGAVWSVVALNLVW